MLNPFFKNVGPFNIEKLLNKTNIENKENFKKDKIYNVSDLATATNKDLTFFHSKNFPTTLKIFLLLHLYPRHDSNM